MTNDTARAILDDLFKKGADPIVYDHGSAHYCQSCRALLWDQFDKDLTGEHKPECPYSRYMRLKEKL